MDDDWKVKQQRELDSTDWYYGDTNYGRGAVGKNLADKARESAWRRTGGRADLSEFGPVRALRVEGSGGGGSGNVGEGGAPGIDNLQKQFEASLANRPDDVFMKKLKAMSADGASFTTDDPSYKWRFDQGQQAVERSNAAKGLLGSGNVLQELQAYGQGAASQEYGAQFNRMLQGTHEASSQYDMAFGQLAKLANIDLGYGQLDVSQQNAKSGRISAEASATSAGASAMNAGTNWQNSQFEHQQTLAQDAGIRDALSGMAFAPPTGGGGYTPNATGTSLPPYRPEGNTSFYSTSGSGGSWSSSSGGSGVF